MKITWIGDEREVPGIGKFRKGDIIFIDDKIANDLIKQGLAEAKVKTVKTKE